MDVLVRLDYLILFIIIIIIIIVNKSTKGWPKVSRGLNTR